MDSGSAANSRRRQILRKKPVQLWPFIANAMPQVVQNAAAQVFPTSYKTEIEFLNFVLMVVSCDGVHFINSFEEKP